MKHIRELTRPKDVWFVGESELTPSGASELRKTSLASARAGSKVSGSLQPSDRLGGSLVVFQWFRAQEMWLSVFLDVPRQAAVRIFMKIPCVSEFCHSTKAKSPEPTWKDLSLHCFCSSSSANRADEATTPRQG